MFNPADVQGNILRGYRKPRVRYLILEGTDRNEARRWLAACVSGPMHDHRRPAPPGPVYE